MNGSHLNFVFDLVCPMNRQFPARVIFLLNQQFIVCCNFFNLTEIVIELQGILVKLLLVYLLLYTDF